MSSGPHVDPFSYALGVIAAFAEVVGAGVKPLALSEPLAPNLMQQLLPEAQRIAKRRAVQLYLEPDLLITDLFAPDVAQGKHVLLIYVDDVLVRYLALKKEREQLLNGNAYTGQARREIAVRFGKLLAYSDLRINALLALAPSG